MGRRAIAVLFLLTCLALAEQRGGSYRRVGLDEVKKLYDTHGALFVDARRFSRYAEGTIMRALNLPVRRVKRMRRWLPKRLDAPILIFCDGPECNASAVLARRLAKAGYSRLMVYPGGYPEWKRRHLPVMAAPVPCRSAAGYRPAQKPVTIDGVRLYTDPEDSSRIDARWIGPILEQGALPVGLHLIDVRSPSQFARAHLPGAINVPFDPEAMELNISRLPARGPILFTCKHGSISTDAWFSLPETLQERSFILDAEVKCRDGECKVSPN